MPIINWARIFKLAKIKKEKFEELLISNQKRRGSLKTKEHEFRRFREFL